jgi:LPXTG-motif cell wall-anchored protein
VGHISPRRPRRKAAAILAAVLLPFLAVLGFGAPAHAQDATTTTCPFIDLEQYLACITPTTEAPTTVTAVVQQNTAVQRPTGSGGTGSGSLPRTGSDTGRLFAIGVALLVLGGAAVYGSTRARTAAIRHG